MHDVTRITDELIERLESSDLRAWDPYDALTSPVVRGLSLGVPRLRQAWTQVGKLSPVNFRPLLLIKPQRSAYALGRVATAYARLAEARPERDWRTSAAKILGWLDELGLPGYPGRSWGYHFNVQTRVFFYPASEPNLIATAFAAKAFLDASDVWGNSEWLDVAAGAAEFITEGLARYTDETGVCLGYLPSNNKPIHNANMLGAAILARVGAQPERSRHADLARLAASFTVACQRGDGSWPYAELPDLRWVDGFHTGFVLEALADYLGAMDDNTAREAYERGLRFYANRLFSEDGLPRYYPDSCWPVDVLSAAQGIEVFSQAALNDSRWLAKADQIAAWAVENLWNPRGWFDYQIRKHYRIRIEYLRWSTAPMLAALARLELAHARLD